jgi:hypothetical protein
VEGLCIAAFAFYCLMLGAFFYLFHDPNAPALHQVLEMRRKAVRRNDKPLAWMLLSIPVVRILFGSGLFAMATGGFAALAGICGVTVPILEQVRLILQDFYRFVERLWVVDPVSFRQAR